VILNIESYSTVLSLHPSGQALCLKATQGTAEAQFKILQRLQETQCAQLKEANQAAKDQLQLIGKIRHPSKYVAVPANPEMDYGQKYVDSINETVGIVAQSWEKCADQLEKSMNAATNKVQQAADTTKRKSEEAVDSSKHALRRPL